MNPVVQNPLTLPPPPAPRHLDSPVTAADLMRWLRLLLGRNPFYILSAVLLLYSMRLLSVDSMASANETPQLLFNFSCFQFYEFLLAGTAIFLAGRRIWYDSGLLVGVENLFLFVPFILISQALLLSNAAAVELCLAACAMAVGRGLWLKRWLPKANNPVTLLVFGAVLLCLNVAAPIVTRVMHENASVRVWDHTGGTLWMLEWSGLMPLLMALALLLQTRPAQAGRPSEALYDRRFFPLLALTLWVAGTGAHFYCIGYVFGMAWEYRLAVPALWMLGWVLWQRRLDLDFLPEKFAPAIEKMLLAGPVALLLLVAIGGLGNVLWLSTLSAAIYGWIAVTRRNRAATHLIWVSLALVASALPLHPAAGVHTKGPDFYPAELAMGVLCAYLILLTLISRRPGMGLLGGGMLSGLVMAAFPDNTMDGNLALNLGLVFAMLHSLRWEQHVVERRCLGVLWIGQCVVWMLMNPSVAARGTFMDGLAVLAVYLGARAISGAWSARVIPWSAAAVMAMTPLRLGILECERAPVGLLILCVSFVMFALGTILAINRERWLPRPRPAAGCGEPPA